MKQFEVLTLSSLEKVFPNRRPELTECKNSCLRDEVFSFQVAYFSPERELMLQNCTWEVEGSLREYIKVRPVLPVPCTTPVSSQFDDYLITQEPSLIPDILSDRKSFYVRYRQWGALWVTVRGELPAGRQEIAITLRDGNGEKLGRAVYMLNVVDAGLGRVNLHYAHWFHYDSLAEYYGLEVFSPAYNEVMARYIANMIEHGADTLLVPLFTPPLNTAVGKERTTVQLVDVALSEGGYSFDFRRLEQFLGSCEKLGVRAFEMSHLYTQWGAVSAPKIIVKTNGKPEQLFGWATPALGEEYAAFISAFLPALTDFLRAGGWGADRCFFHISDEPNRQTLEHYLQIRRFVKPLLGEYRVMDALSSYEFYEQGAVDIPVVATDSTQAFMEGGAEGWWTYYCCGQAHSGLSNRFLSMPLQRVRILGFQLYASGCRGFLHWGYNYYNSALSEEYINPYLITDAGGSFQSGDSFIVYPGKDAPLDSLRHEAMFDAVQDYGALNLLERRKGRKFVMEFLQANGLSANFTDYPRSALWHNRLRREINRMIAESVDDRPIEGDAVDAGL